MSFYGPPREHLGQVMSGLESVEKVYDQHGLTTFMQDNLVALMRNQSFTADAAFTAALLSNADDERDRSKIWRLHTCCWAARSALALEGDFVECGTYKGFYAGVIMQYLRFDGLPRQFYLYVSRTRFPWTQNWLNRSVQGGPEHDR